MYHKKSNIYRNKSNFYTSPTFRNSQCLGLVGERRSEYDLREANTASIATGWLHIVSTSYAAALGVVDTASAHKNAHVTYFAANDSTVQTGAARGLRDAGYAH